LFGGIVAVGSATPRLCDSDYIFIANLKRFALCGFQHAVHYDFGQVVTFTDDWSADAAGYGTYHFRHYDIPPFLNLWTLPPLLFYGLLPK